MQYVILCVILCAIGLFFIIVSICAQRAERSGLPFIGGIFIAIGFLVTPVKWLAFLGLIDYSYWSLPYAIISELIIDKRFQAVYSEQNYSERVRDDTKILRVKIPERNEELLKPYITNAVHELRIPRLLFSVCTDKTGKRFLLADKCVKGSSIEILDFDRGYILFTELKSKDVNMTVEIEIVNENQTSADT